MGKGAARLPFFLPGENEDFAGSMPVDFLRACLWFHTIGPGARAMKFKTNILLIGNNTGIEVPPEVIEGLGGGKKPAVVVGIGSYSYRSSVAVMGGKYLISLSAERRAESGLKGGDPIEV